MYNTRYKTMPQHGVLTYGYRSGNGTGIGTRYSIEYGTNSYRTATTEAVALEVVERNSSNDSGNDSALRRNRFGSCAMWFGRMR